MFNPAARRFFLLIMPLALGLSHSAIAAKVPALTDTINPLPGPPCYFPLPIAINSTTKRVYTAGAGSTFGSNGRVSVIDAETNSVIAAFSLPWGVDAIAVNEATNKIYLGTSSGPDGAHLAPQITVIDGATNQVTGNFSGNLGVNVLLDPTTGRLFALSLTNPFYVNVYDGTSLSLLATIGLTNGSDNVHGSSMALNPTSRKLYISDSNDVGRIAVVDLDALVTKPFIHTGTKMVGNIAVDPGTNELFAATVVSNGGNTPVVLVINSASDVIVTSISLTQDDFGVVGGYGVGVTVDATRHRAYFSDSNPVTHVIDTQNNVSLGSSPWWFSFGGVLAGSGKLYVTQYTNSVGSAFGKENAVGVIDPTNGGTKTITVGYRPISVAVDSGRGRLYVADEQSRDILTIDVASHAILFRTATEANTRDALVNDEGFRDIAVCESLNRIYATRTTAADPSNGLHGNMVDILDGATGTLAGAITVGSDDYYHARLAVDNARHRLFISARSNSTSQATLNVYNLDNNALITTIALPFIASAVAVNPDNGRVYVDGGSGFGGNNVVVINSLTNQIVTTLSAGAVPGEIAINRQTNKVYIANNGAGSADNDVTVINGATDAVETTFNNTNSNNGDAVAGVGIDDITNTVYVSDNSNQFDATGRVTIFNPLQNYQFLGQIELGHYPGRMVFDAATRQMFVSNNASGYISVLGNGVPPPPPVPAHGGLSATVFRINGSQSPANNLSDTALHFSAQQSGTPEGLVVRVQINTVADNNRIDWVNLNNGSGKGYMTIDQTTGQFVLSSTNYPNASGMYFRALSSAPGYPDSKSNIIGPFNLPYGQAHLSPTTLYGKTNGAGQEMNFRADVGVDQAGITLYIQSTTTPDDDASWVGLNDGRAGQMHEYDSHTSFYLDTTKYPSGDPVYFRAVAKAPGFVQSFSNIVGIKDVVNGAPPTLDIVPPSPQPGSQSGLDADHPIIAAMGTLNLGITNVVSPDGKTIKRLGLVYDGATIEASETGGSSLNTQYITTVPGDHVLKAFAIDDRGIAGFAQPAYIRIKPAGAKLVRMVSSGDWSNAANWRDENSNPGIPGPNDFAVVGSFDATLTQNINGSVVTLSSGSITGAGGSLTIAKFFTVAGGQLKNLNLTINAGAIMALVSDTNIPASGTVTNNGTVRITGRGGFVPVPNGTRAANRPASPDGLFDGVAAFFKNAGAFIVSLPKRIAAAITPPSTPQPIPLKRGVYAAKFENSGSLLSENGLGLITNDGGSLITNDGGSIIGNDGASLITNDGGSIIGNDGASAISHDGSSLITNDGGSRPALSIEPAAPSADSGFVQTGGQLDLNGITIESSISLNGGTLTGSGVVVGSLANNGGFISPGHSAGTISVVGDFSQGGNGTLIVETGGKNFGQADQLQIGGTATLGGILHIKTINGFAIDPADTFSPLGYGAVNGAFNSSGGNASLTLSGNGVLVSVNPNAPQPQSGQPLNIATRMSVQTGDNVLIAGFIVTGPSGSTKKVLIRGLGPSLAQFGVPNTLSDPLLELHKSDGTVINDNWQQGDTSQIPNGFAPGDPREAVIVATLTPGNYSAVVKGAHGETGVGIAELYDLDSASPAKLANISTRGFINTGDDVMIGGFIVGGTEPAKVLVRAIGPTLTDFGVQGALADPTLELHDSNGMTIANDDWRETQESEIIATTIPPNKDREPAILATLAPGNYTAVVRGKNNTTGVGLVEAYNLQ
ncbi:MAG: hypothetical protein QOE26_2941 [Verrucomicrobiota bacterium]|jgi:DNA-binding beta-propeller fold protein YncE